MRNSLFILICLLSTVACTTVERGDFIRVKGVDFVDSEGNKYPIRGINLGNWLNPEGYMFLLSKTSSASEINRGLCQLVGEEYASAFWRRFTANYVTRKDIEFLRTTGINSVRLPFHYKLFTPEPYLGGSDPERGFAIIDSLVGWCGDNGLRLILDMHCAPGGQTGDNIDDSYGYPWLFESDAHQQTFIRIWEAIAARYKDQPVILGYDLLNEPIAHYFDNQAELNAKLEPLYIKAVESIRRVDKNHIIFLAGAQWNGNFDCFSDWQFDDNIAYTCHSYWGPPNEESLTKILAFRQKSGLPMYMGETGENTDEWVAQFKTTLERNNIGWHFWPYKKMAHGASFVQIPKPEGWDLIVGFLEADRSGYGQIRAARPDQRRAREILDNYLDLCLLDRCTTNSGYINALTKE